MKLGAQLYTVRMFTQTIQDFQRTIAKIAEIGYSQVQLSAIGSEISPEDAKRICDASNIEIVLTHSDGNRILGDTDRLIEEHKKMGCRYIGLGSMPEKYRGEDWISYFIEDFKRPAEKIKEAGMLLMYHNHDFEFERINGRYLINFLLEGFTPEELGITLDTYWVQAAGCDVCWWIEAFSGRIPCVHLKDRGIVNRNVGMAPVLEGNMNFEAILETLAKSGCQHALVEQDICLESPFYCLEKSFRNLKKLGEKSYLEF